MNGKFSILTHSQRVWAIGAIHGTVDKLTALHQALESRLRPGDRLVYLGNMMGRGDFVLRTLHELVDYRRYFLARFQGKPEDVVYLRGAQEEMWQKLMQLQFAPDPGSILDWMLSQGVGQSLRAYDLCAQEGRDIAEKGAIELTKWTNSLRRAMKQHPGHYELFGTLKRAAMTGDSLCSPGRVLFVNCGLDATKPLDSQKDSFWWDNKAFNRIQSPYGSFTRIVRGFDPDGLGFEQTAHILTLDGGCGFDGGTLFAACLSPEGAILDVIEC